MSAYALIVTLQHSIDLTQARDWIFCGDCSTCDSAPHRVAFRYANSAGTPDFKAFAAQWLACSHPCQRFVPHLTVRYRTQRGVGMRDLGTLGGNYSYAYGINASGQVVGYSQTTAGDPHAFITGPNGMGMTDIGALGSG